MAEIDELKQLAIMADQRGDKETAIAAMRKIDALSQQPATQPQAPMQSEQPSIMDTLGAGFKRGLKQVAVGATQGALSGAKYLDDVRIERLAAGMQDGSIPVTQENLDFLDRLQGEAVTKAKAMQLAQGYEGQQREEFKPYQDQNPISATVGNIAGQIAAAPLPAARVGLAGQVAKGAAEGAAIGYAQPTVEGESRADNAEFGSMVGGAVPLALRPIGAAAKGIYRGVTGEASGEAAQVAQYADANNLPLMTTDAMQPKTPVGMGAQTVAEKIPFVGTGGMRSTQQDSRVKLANELSEKYGIPSDKEMVDSLARKTEKHLGAAGKRYESIISQMGDTPIPLNNTVAAIDSQIASYTRPGAIGNDKVVNVLNDIKSKVLAGDNNLAEMRQNRTIFRELFKDASGATTDTANRSIDAVYDGITADMNKAVGQKLGQKTLRELNQADNIWRAHVDVVKNTKLKNLLVKGDIKPELASSMLFNRGSTEVKTLFNSLDTVGRSHARAAILSRIAEASKESPDMFLNKITSQQYKQQIETFFKGEDKKALIGAINYLKYTKQAARAAANPINGAQVAQVGIPAVAGGALFAGGLKGLAAVGAISAAARVYESKPVRDLLLKMASVPKDSTRFEQIANELEGELNRAATRIQDEDNQ